MKHPVCRYQNFILIHLGSLLFSLAYLLFFDRNSIVPGGISGLSAVLSGITGRPFGVFNLSLNLPAMVVGLLLLGPRKIALTVYAIVLTSLCVDFGRLFFTGVTGSAVAACLVGGLVYGVGTGLIFRAGISVGGTSLIGQLLNFKFPALRLGLILCVVDGAVVLFSLFVYQNSLLALLSAAAVLVTSFSVDQIVMPGSLLNRFLSKLQAADWKRPAQAPLADCGMDSAPPPTPFADLEPAVQEK